MFAGNETGGSFEWVWDGTRSTGPRELGPLEPGYPFALLIGTVREAPNPNGIKVDWTFTALDANGNDVGFTCAGNPPS